MRILGTIIIVILTSIFCMNAGSLPAIGDHNSAPNTHITPRYIEMSKVETGSPNVVTGVLADYRGFDTLGETSVMFVAGLTTVLILRAGKEDKAKKKPSPKGAKK